MGKKPTAPVMKRGDTGAAVIVLQQALRDKFDATIKVDGDFGEKTEKVVLAFQKAHGLKPDGIVGSITMGILLDKTAALAAATKGNTMDKITEDILIKGLGLGAAMATKLIPHVNAALQEFGINTERRIAMFLANCAHESGNFAIMVENLNYSAEGLAKTWPKRFANANGTPNQVAKSLAKNPQAIANFVYADRMGNGAPTTGDGWKYRGRGPLQITGKDNYTATGKAIGVDLITYPEKLEEYPTGLRAAAHHVVSEGAQAYADKGDFDGYCDEVNFGRKTEKVGDAIGFADRKAKYVKLCTALGI